MKDQEILLLVVGLAGLAYVVSQSKSDKPAPTVTDDFTDDPWQGYIKTLDPQFVKGRREAEADIGLSGFGPLPAQYQDPAFLINQHINEWNLTERADWWRTCGPLLKEAEIAVVSAGQTGEPLVFRDGLKQGLSRSLEDLRVGLDKLDSFMAQWADAAHKPKTESMYYNSLYRDMGKPNLPPKAV